MTTDVQALRELLERAFELESKAAAVSDPGVEELRTEIAQLQDDLYALTSGDTELEAEGLGELGELGAEPVGVDDDEDEDEGDVGMDFDVPDDAPVDAEVAERVDASVGDAPTEASSDAGPERVADAVEGKAAGWAPCPNCGSTDADEYADGTARCADCGTQLAKAGSTSKDSTPPGGSDTAAEADRMSGKDDDGGLESKALNDEFVELRAQRLALELMSE